MFCCILCTTLLSFNSFRSKFETASSMYHKLGQHTYFNADLLFPIKIRKRNDYGSYIYFGHLYEETKQREGVGISVDCDGDTLQSNYQNVYTKDVGKMIKWMAKADIQSWLIWMTNQPFQHFRIFHKV